eukprot:2778620-Pyramimonas_sp.AAC.1
MPPDACSSSGGGGGKVEAEARARLQSFLRASDCYDVGLVLRAVEPLRLWEELVVLYAKTERHADALHVL